MHRYFKLALVFALAFYADTGLATEFGTRQEAVQMVDLVEQMYEAEGPQATFAAVSDKSNEAFHDRDLYVFIYDFKGVNVAHGHRPVLIGKNLISLKDQDGKYLIQEMIAIAQTTGSGWVEYKWPSPITNRIEDKISYIKKLGSDYFVGVGVRP